MDQIQVILDARRRLARIQKLRDAGKTLQEIADAEGCTRQRVHIILARAASRRTLPARLCPACGFARSSPVHRRECGARKKRA